ncbi:MAG: hypothetical protein IT449_12415 [Phycisphaerales bacterium]|nr:hypothetical protein [Phycisphaerales bacterium]
MSTRPSTASTASDAVVPFQVPERVGRTPGKREVFRAMIEWEAISGSLTPSRRRRLVRYAAQLGLSATQAGELIRACVDCPQAMRGSSRAERNLQPAAIDLPRAEQGGGAVELESPPPNLRYVPAPTSASQEDRPWMWTRLAPFGLASLAIAALLALRLLR